MWSASHTAVSLGKAPLHRRLRGLGGEDKYSCLCQESKPTHTTHIPATTLCEASHLLLGMNNNFWDFILLVALYICCKSFGTAKYSPYKFTHLALHEHHKPSCIQILGRRLQEMLDLLIVFAVSSLATKELGTTGN